MKAKDFERAYRQSHDGESFGNLSEIARFMGIDRAIIRPLLKGLPKFHNSYFILDVGEVIERLMK